VNELLTLIKREWQDDERVETTREVFCRLASIGYREFYQASATEYHPEAKFILADYLEYNGETLAKYNGILYRIIRTYRTGQEIELVVERAPAEEAIA
jgi:hypothetical protein